MTASSSTSATLTGLATVTAAMSLTAVVTYYWTQRNEEKKYLEEKKAIYDRELLIKQKTLEARKLTGEPSGTIVEDVSIEKVYLWEVEDLKKRFQPSQKINRMKNIVKTNGNPYFFPSLNKQASSISEHEHVNKKDEKSMKTVETNYNKLITNHECILADLVRKPNMPTRTHAYVRAGPRKTLHFDPDKVNAAIVTCGGLCPGLNNVIREIVKTLKQSYGIGGTIYGIQGGYRGFHDFESYPPIELTPELVQNIHHEGGTVLGSSRGGFDLDKICDFLQSRNVSQLFVIGGDGTHRGAFKIHEACMERVRIILSYLLLWRSSLTFFCFCHMRTL